MRERKREEREKERGESMREKERGERRRGRSLQSSLSSSIAVSLCLNAWEKLSLHHLQLNLQLEKMKGTCVCSNEKALSPGIRGPASTFPPSNSRQTLAVMLIHRPRTYLLVCLSGAMGYSRLQTWCKTVKCSSTMETSWHLNEHLNMCNCLRTPANYMCKILYTQYAIRSRQSPTSHGWIQVS